MLSAIQVHLHSFKWKECAFTSSLLRSTRWLVGAGRKVDQNYMRGVLVVTAETQLAFIQSVYLPHFLRSIRKMRPSARAKARPSVEEFDRLVDYTCMMMKVIAEAKVAKPDNTDVHQQLFAAMSARHWGMLCSMCFCVWATTLHVTSFPGTTRPKSWLLSATPCRTSKCSTSAFGQKWWSQQRRPWSLPWLRG